MGSSRARCMPRDDARRKTRLRLRFYEHFAERAARGQDEPMPAQDPEEPFDLCDDEGHLLGRSKARALVHRDGDWHRSLHLWVVLIESAPFEVVFQRRSPEK